jgi:hypothetical protein
MKQVNDSAYNKAVEYVASRNANICTIVMQYVSEGAFIILKDKLNALPSTQHVTYDHSAKKARVLVSKSMCHHQRTPEAVGKRVRPRWYKGIWISSWSIPYKKIHFKVLPQVEDNGDGYGIDVSRRSNTAPGRYRHHNFQY